MTSRPRPLPVKLLVLVQVTGDGSDLKLLVDGLLFLSTSSSLTGSVWSLRMAVPALPSTSDTDGIRVATKDGSACPS